MSLDRLIEKIEQTQNPTVAGLDPKLDYVPEYIRKKCFEKYGETLKGAAKALLEFNKGLIDALYDIVPAVKPQAAYYEMYGPAGVKTLYKTQEYARSKGMYVITDGKRNDIGTTMEAYATAHLGKVKIGGSEFEPFLGDALTVNGYLGSDGIKPLLKVCAENDKGIFVLAKPRTPQAASFRTGSSTASLSMRLWAKCARNGARSFPEFTVTAALERLSERLIPNRLKPSASCFRTRSSLSPATALRERPRRISRARSMKTVLAAS